MKLLKTFLRMPMQQKLLFPRAFFVMLRYRHLVRHRPFKELAPRIGTLGYETPVEVTPHYARTVHELMNAMFCRDSSLIRALTAKKLLNRAGEKCTLYMGVCKEPGSDMQAHAWLRCGRLTVTGGETSSRYTVTAVFGDKA